MTIVEPTRAVTGGVDTHLDVHVAAALDELGGLLGTESFATTPAGYLALWSCSAITTGSCSRLMDEPGGESTQAAPGSKRLTRRHLVGASGRRGRSSREIQPT